MRTARIKVTATLIGVILLIVGIMSLFPEESSDDKQIPRQTQQSKQQVQLVGTIPSYRLGVWKIMLGKEYSTKFCLSVGNYAKIEGEDKSVGITYLPQRLNKKWSEPMYEPLGENIELGDFMCLKVKSDKPVIAEVTISRNPM